MKLDRRSAMVKCPTCNQNVCEMLGYAEEPHTLKLEFVCENELCPARDFAFVFRVAPGQTIMDVIIGA